MRKPVIFFIGIAMLILGSSTSIVASPATTCKLPSGFVDTGHKTLDGQIHYQSVDHPNTFFRCGTQSEQQMAATNAANQAKDPKLHTICEAQAVPGHQAGLIGGRSAVT